MQDHWYYYNQPIIWTKKLEAPPCGPALPSKQVSPHNYDGQPTPAVTNVT